MPKGEGRGSKENCMRECNKIDDCTGVEWFQSGKHDSCLLTVTGWGDGRVNGGADTPYHDAQCFAKRNNCDHKQYTKIEVKDER
jgi:hypothetical protein